MKIENSNSSNKEILKMKFLLIIRLFFVFLLLIVFPFSLHSIEMDLSLQEVETSKIVEAPKQMSQKEMNDLFGEDPYLGQTSYLQSPYSFRQRESSK